MDQHIRSRLGATIKVRNFAALQDVLEDLGVEPAHILQSAGLDARLFLEPETTLLFSDLDRLVGRCLDATGCESLGLRTGMKQGLTAIGLAGLVSMNCPTVREALSIVISGLRTTDTGGAVSLDVRGLDACLGYFIIPPGVENADQITDGAMAILANAMRKFCGPAWRPAHVFLTRNRPSDLSLFIRFFDAPIEFEAPRAMMTFDAGVLDRAVRSQDPVHREILAPLLDQALDEANKDLAPAVKVVLRNRIGAGPLTRTHVAQSMSISRHALISNLKASGVTFAELTDQVRIELAQSLLLKGKSINEVSTALGFSEVSSFTRAFKRWLGKSPARWRAERNAPRIVGGSRN